MIIIRAVTTDPVFLSLIGNSDFDSMSRMETFEASSTGSMLCVNITLIGDSVYEGDEQFLVNLTNSQMQARVGPITQACITIRDDDGRLISCNLCVRQIMTNFVELL